ncbi:MAG: protein kinase [Gemmatimonadetes bacterium]|nr:protein kinase [Gemmatimonadota bacterium]
MYRARDQSLEIDVALKVLKPAFAHDPIFEENFRREAHRAAKFRHPSVIAIHYAGKEGEVVFFSMDYLEKGLKDLIAEGPVEERKIVRVGMDVSSALQFAHTFEGGIVHRDLKPDNIRFDRHGNAVVTDFGIAQVATNYTAATGTTVSVGTPRYMSPEQARGRKVDQRSDIYSLGVTLYEMATGQAPFTGADWFELGRKHIEEPPVPPRERGATISPGLEQVILTCIEKEPDDRFRDAEEVHSELKALAAGGETATVVTPRTLRPRVRITSETPQKPAAPAEKAAGPGIAVAAAWLRWPVVYTGAAALLVLAALGAYSANVAGVQAWAEQKAPLLARVPLIRSGRVYVRPPSYVTVEGGADVTSTFTLTFSGPIDPRTATSANVQLVGPDSAPVPAQVRVVQDLGAVEIDPDGALEFGAQYAVVVGAGLLGASGAAVMERAGARAPGARFTFTTSPPPADHESPRLAESVPARGAQNVPPAGPITLTFDEAVDPATVDTVSVRLYDGRRRAIPVQIFCCANSQRTARIEPAAALRERTAYMLLLSRWAPIKDRAGNPLQPDSVVFRTGTVAAASATNAPPSAGGVGAPAGAVGAAVGGAGTRPEATGPAFFNIHVEPAAFGPYVVVTVNGEAVGEPPVSGYAVDGGKTHPVEVFGVPEFSAFRISVYREEHRAVAGESSDIVARIQPFGSISVNSNPAGIVYVDGKEVRRTPLGGFPVRSGRHRVEVRPVGADAERYDPYAVEVRVEPLEWKTLGTVTLPGK